jgi:hypothetical protein
MQNVDKLEKHQPAFHAILNAEKLEIRRTTRTFYNVKMDHKRHSKIIMKSPVSSAYVKSKIVPMLN